MKSDKKLVEILLEIYREIYNNVTPKCNFDKEDKQKEGWFLKYTIDETLSNDIIDKICKKYKLSKHDISKINISYYLGASPKFKK